MRGCRSSHGKEQGPLVHLVSLPLLKNSLLVQLDQTGQVLVAVVCNLLVASEQLLSTLGEGAGQTAVTGLVCQQSLILLVVHSLGGQGEGVLAQIGRASCRERV